MQIKYSKDIECILNIAKETCIDLRRPYICPDILWEAIINHHSGSVEEILVEQLGFDLSILNIAVHSFLSGMKESKSPKTNLNKDARDILKLSEKLRKILSEDDITSELLLLALVTHDKPSKFFSFLLEEYGYSQEDYITCITCFITGKELFFELSEEDSEEIDFDFEPCILDPYEDNKILDEFCINLNKEAYKGKFDNLIPFEDKIKKLSIVLCRTNKPNAIIVGPQGGGKTSVIMSLAKKIVDGDASPFLKEKVIFEVSLSSMVAGTEFRGNFEERLKNLIDEARKYENVILFFDEIHTLIGAGGTGKKGDLEASNILKPYLATGEICCIGATTDYEYNQKFKKDKALDRRFEKIDFSPPTREQAEKMVPILIEFYEKQNETKFSKDFKDDVIPLCEQLMPNRNYPDKLVDAIDYSIASAKVEGKKTVTKDIYLDFFNQKTGILGNKKELEVLLKEINNSEISKILNKFSKDILKEKEKPNILGICGNRNLSKKFSSFLKKKGFSFYSFSGKTFNSVSDITGFSEDYLFSVSQKVSSSESPVVIINDADCINNKIASLLSEIFKEGEILMKNGEMVSFSNTLFILFGGIDFSQKIGFGKKDGKRPKFSGSIEKQLENVVIV